MRTLKLCRRGEPGIFSHVNTIKGRRGQRDLCMGIPEISEQENRMQIAGNLLHILGANIR